MLRHLIAKEILENITSPKFVVSFVAITLLIISGLVIGSEDYRAQRGDYTQQRLLNQELLSSQGNWTTAGQRGIFETKRPSVLYVIDHGIENSLGRQAEISTAKETQFDQSRNLVAPILAVFGDVDVTFVVKFILSLFVVLLTYDAISGEKERGMLKLILSNSVPRYKVILSKIFGGYISLGVAFLVPLLIGMIFLMILFPDVLADFSDETWTRLAIIGAIYMLYIGVFFAGGLLISTLTKRSSTSFILLLIIWVLFVSIIPRLSMAAAEKIKPYDSYLTMQKEASKEIAGLQEDLRKRFADQQEMQKAALQGKFGEFMAELFRDYSKAQQKIWDKTSNEYLLRQSSQIETAQLLTKALSPASSMSFVVHDIAGTGWNRHNEYIRQLRVFQKEFTDYIFDQAAKKKINPATFYDDWFEFKKLDVDLNKITMTFKEESLAQVMARSVWDIGILVITSLIFFAGATVAFLRYDVR